MGDRLNYLWIAFLKPVQCVKWQQNKPRLFECKSSYTLLASHVHVNCTSPLAVHLGPLLYSKVPGFEEFSTEGE